MDRWMVEVKCVFKSVFIVFSEIARETFFWLEKVIKQKGYLESRRLISDISEERLSANEKKYAWFCKHHHHHGFVWSREKMQKKIEIFFFKKNVLKHAIHLK